MVTKRDPDAARRKILEAATQAFATLGPAGARIDAIAAAAGVNKRMLYHYFGDKEALFAAVLDDRLGADPQLPSASAALADGVSLSEVNLRLMVWATIAGVAPGAEHATGWQRLIAEFTEAQRAGRVREDVDAGLIALVVFAVSAVAELLPEYVRLMGIGDDLPWAQLCRLAQTEATEDRSVPRRNRPRVRMLPDVRAS